jgi:nitroreductase
MRKQPMNQEVYAIILTCRAVRHFADTPISEDDLRRILEAGRWTGSAKNVQPWHFLVVRDQETLDQLARCGRYASHLRGAAAAVVLVTSPGTWADFDAGRAAQNMMLAAWSLGIGSCIASLHDAKRARDILKVPEEFQTRIAISFGYPLRDAPQTIEGRPREEVLASIGRLPLEKLVHWDTW